jgi:hypothetical protein
MEQMVQCHNELYSYFTLYCEVRGSWKSSIWVLTEAWCTAWSTC